MDRLTARNENGDKEAYYPYCFQEDTCDGCGSSEKCDGCGFSREVYEALASYEDTSLTPEQIQELMKRDIAKAPRAVSERSLYACCLNCGQIIFRNHKFCPECGQRLKRED